MEVLVLPEEQRPGRLQEVRKAALSPGGSLLCCLETCGLLRLWLPAHREEAAAALELDGRFLDFCWEEAEPGALGAGSVRLLAVGSGAELQLVEVEAAAGVSLRKRRRCPAERLLDAVRQQNHGVEELQSLLLVSFVAQRCCVLVNWEWLLQLHWEEGSPEPRTASCCSVQLTGSDSHVHHCVCAEMLFVLSSSGLTYVFAMVGGALLATIDLRPYLSSDWLGGDPPPSFRLFQVSADLSTAVAVTDSHAAVALDLNQYFRLHPDRLHAAAAKPRPLEPQDAADQDSLAALGTALRHDRSWAARLAAMFDRAPPSEAPWFHSLPRPRPAAASCRSAAPPGGAAAVFSAPPAAAPSLLAVSEFSAVLTFVAPGNTGTTVALWDMESGSVSYHPAEGVAVPVQHCGEAGHRLLLKGGALVQVLFCSQQELLSRLMLFGSPATVDAVCHLNSWGRCSVPFHALQAGLKNRQLDSVDLYLKSKENVLNPPEQEADAQQSLSDGVQELLPALDLLRAAVAELSGEAQSRQFSEQLLGLTLTFLHAQIRSALSGPHSEQPDVRRSVEILDRYVSKLRASMKRSSWPPGGAVREAATDEWEQLSTEEVIYRSILTNQMPRAQAVMLRRRRPERHLAALRTSGCRHVLSCLQRSDLDSAKKLLTNMGLDVKEELLSICMFTSNRDLRELLVQDLWGRGCLDEDRMRNVSFIREAERLGQLPTDHQTDPTSHRSAGLVLLEPDGGGVLEVLEELQEQPGPEEAAELWRNLRLDWVENWDQDGRTAVLLSRLQHIELSGRPAVLWHHLTALHHQQKVLDWIHHQGSSSSAPWPDIDPEMVNDHTACSTFLRENILDLLARRGVFIPEEMSDLEQLLWRLAQSRGVMAASLPVPQYRPPVGFHLHSVFITFCLDRGLQYLLYSYLEHYRLTPRNCPALLDQSLLGGQPWFQMMVKTQEISRDLSEPGAVFQASLSAAQVLLLPGSQACLSSLLLEGHSLLALASVMFAHGGIDQVVPQGQRSKSLEGAVDPQLLKMALSPHYKLRAALFPSGGCGSGAFSDVSVYHLLQSLHPLDPSRLFGWQAANTLSCTEPSELPHFSSSPLVGQFALVEKLDFLYYIQHGRPSFAYGNFLLLQLGACGSVPLLLQDAARQVYRCALRWFHRPSVAASAVCFCELLGICSLKLRVDLRALNAVLQHWNQLGRHSPAHNLHALASKAAKLQEAEPGAAEELLEHLEAAVGDALEQRAVSSWSYEACQEWALPVQFCRLHGLRLSAAYPRRCAHHRRLLHFLLFAQLHSFPPQQVRSLMGLFGPTLQAHLSLAFQDLQWHGGGGGGFLRAERSGERPQELLQVLLHSQKDRAASSFLLQEAVVRRCPLLAVLAACLQGQEAEPGGGASQGAELLPCLCVWLLSGVDEATAAEATSHLAEDAQHHRWSLHDLSVLWRTLLTRGHVRLLLRGFQLFLQDCPLVLVLRMFELCCDHRKFAEAKAELLDFQRALITLRAGGPAAAAAAMACSLPPQWVESQASTLLLALLQRCSSHYDLHRLLQLLADVDKLLRSNGPDFRKLSQLSRALQGSGVTLPRSLLHCTSPSVQQEALRLTVDALQAGGRYGRAREVAALSGLPVQDLLLSQLLQEAVVQRARWQWRRLDTRAVFWQKCQRRLEAAGADPDSAWRFFLREAEARRPADEAALRVLDVAERCLLLQLAARWLARKVPVPLDELRRLEKQLWLRRIQKQVLDATAEQQSLFRPPAEAAGAYAAFAKELSLSAIAQLNLDADLSLDGFPAPPEERPAADTEPELGAEERRALELLIGRLLDEGSVHEASRVCRHFNAHNCDVWLALRCHALAGGELVPEPEEEHPEGAPALTHAPSLSSLSSFVMLPPPEDAVAVHIQKLVDQCRHGNDYCKQVLSLYQLSKELQRPFSQVSRESPRSVLEKLLLLGQPDRFRTARTFIAAQGLGSDATAELVADALLQGLMAAGQELPPERLIFRPAEGAEVLLQLIRLVEDPNVLGLKLLERLSGLPLRELSCMVELLVVAHSCFSLTCNMEGIVRVLQAARHLSHAHLAPGEHHGLLVRLLTGIGRYNEMTYVFDLLHQNHCFEMLLRKKVDRETGQSSSLKTALLDYIRRFLPADSEKHNMVALCFSMRREIGENHEIAARTQLKMIESQSWAVTPDLKSSLVKVLGLLKDAAESFSKDSCVHQASGCVRKAKLVALQLHLLNRGSGLRLVNLKPAEMHAAIMALPRCYQVLVVSEAYGFAPDWAEVLFQKVLLQGDFVYLEELKRRRPLSAALFQDIFRKLDAGPAPAAASVSSNAKRLLGHCDDVYARYRLAYRHGVHDVTRALLQDGQSRGYMSDRLGGTA